MHLRWHYQTLDENQKMIYESFLSQIRMEEGAPDDGKPLSAHSPAAQNLLPLCVPRIGLSKDGFYEKEIYNDILMGILLDDPSLFQLDLTEVSFIRDASSLTVILRLVYDSGAHLILFEKMQAKAREICAQAGLLKTERQKILYLHDYLCGGCEYHAHDDSAPPHDRYILSREIHTIVGALQNESCVCDGMASAFLYLCEQCGIACIHVRGQLIKDKKAATHAWNLVECEGTYRHMDLCLDCLNSERTIAKEYCFKTDADMEASHRWDRDRYPKTDEARQC